VASRLDSLLSVGGSFAARWARMVLKRCSSERGEREKRFYGDGKDERYDNTETRDICSMNGALLTCSL